MDINSMNKWGYGMLRMRIGRWAAKLIAAIAATLSLLAVPAVAQVVYYHNDFAGSPMAATDEAGSLLWREGYRPYGERVLKPASANNQWFHGKQVDPGTGVADFGARNYDPTLGRFLGIDPVDFKEKNIHSFNRYSYGNSNPLKYKDPNGESALDIGFFLYDAGALAVAVYSGQGIAVAAIDLAASTVGLVSPVPFVGQAIKGARAAQRVSQGVRGVEHVAEVSRVARGGLSAFERASEFGIRQYSELRALTKGTGLEAHHIIEKRFADVLGVNPNSMKAIALTKEEHQAFTNAWRQAIPYAEGTANATTEQIMNAAKQIYKDYPEILRLFGVQ